MGVREIASFAVIGIFGQVVAQLGITWGVRFAPASNAALLSLTLPIATAVMAYLLLGERMTAIRWLSFALAVVGVLQCSGVDWDNLRFASGGVAVGNLLIVLGVLGSAFYNVYSRKLLHWYTGLEVLIYGYAVAAILCAGASIYLDKRPFYDMTAVPPAAWAAVFVLGSLTWGISMVLFMWLLKFVDIAQISVSIYLLSFFGVLLSAATLGERIQAVQIVGALVVIAAALLSDSYERRAARPTGAAST